MLYPFCDLATLALLLNLLGEAHDFLYREVLIERDDDILLILLLIVPLFPILSASSTIGKKEDS